MTGRSLSGSSDMIRITPESVFSGHRHEVIVDSTLDYWVNSLTQLDFNHTRVVNHMKASEAAKGQMVLRDGSESSSLGVFSLRGFTGAYDAIGQLCPEPPKEHGDASVNRCKRHHSRKRAEPVL